MDEGTAGMLLTDLRYGLGFVVEAVSQLKAGRLRLALDSLERALDGSRRVEEGLVRAVEAEQLEAELDAANLVERLVEPSEECQACGGVDHPGHTCSAAWSTDEILAREG